jgi:hypothetical protein
LRWHGYRATKRYVVFQVLPHTIGLSAALTRILAKSHELRNLAEYEGVAPIGETILSDLLMATGELASAVSALKPLR